MNKVILMGRLTRDVDYRQTQGENAASYARFTLAVDRRYGRRDGAEQTADFISCVAWRNQADFLEKYCRQGTKICLEGRIQTGSYTNREGQKVYTTEVVVENVEFAESKAASQGGYAAPAQNQGYSAPASGNQGYSAPAPQNRGYSAPAPAAPAPQSDIAAEGFMSIPDDVGDEGLPFN